MLKNLVIAQSTATFIKNIMSTENAITRNKRKLNDVDDDLRCNANYKS